MGDKNMPYAGEVEFMGKVMGVGVSGKIKQELPVEQCLAPGAYIPPAQFFSFGADFAGTKESWYPLCRRGSQIKYLHYVSPLRFPIIFRNLVFITILYLFFYDFYCNFIKRNK